MLSFLILFLIFLNFFILLDLSPIHKIFILIILYILGSIIMMILDNYYLGLTYIIIYVGAIAILFLFVIMMLNLQTVHLNVNNTYYFILLFLIIPYILNENIDILNYLNINWFYSYFKLYSIHSISIFLFTSLYIYIFIIGIILWVILIGILGLGKK